MCRLELAVDRHVPDGGCIDPPANGVVVLASRVVELAALDVDRLAGQEVVAAALVEVQVRVDDEVKAGEVDVLRAQRAEARILCRPPPGAIRVAAFEALHQLPATLDQCVFERDVGDRRWPRLAVGVCFELHQKPVSNPDDEACTALHAGDFSPDVEDFEIPSAGKRHGVGARLDIRPEANTRELPRRYVGPSELVTQVRQDGVVTCQSLCHDREFERLETAGAEGVIVPRGWYARAERPPISSR